MFNAIIYNSFCKLKKCSHSAIWKAVQNLNSGTCPSSSFPASLICPPFFLTVRCAQEGTARRQYYSQFPQGLVKRMGLHSQPYGVLEFLGTNQHGNLKSYLGNKTCVTRNRPSPKYILVYVHSGIRHMSLGGFEVVSKGQAFFLLKNVSTSLGTASTLFHLDNFKMEFFSTLPTNLYLRIHIF